MPRASVGQTIAWSSGDLPKPQSLFVSNVIRYWTSFVSSGQFARTLRSFGIATSRGVPYPSSFSSPFAIIGGKRSSSISPHDRYPKRVLSSVLPLSYPKRANGTWVGAGFDRRVLIASISGRARMAARLTLCTLYLRRAPRYSLEHAGGELTSTMSSAMQAPDLAKVACQART
jgi:hypothetical protein